MGGDEGVVLRTSNSKDSCHGALVTPVISRSMATKSAAPTWLFSLESAESKFDLVTCFRGNVEEEEKEVYAFES